MPYAIIDPEGMFGGDRMALLSDSARFAWPWFWAAHNTVGRSELNYRTFCDVAFRQFKKKPTDQQFWDWVSEFHECHLMYVYRSGDKVWGQWDVPETLLPRHKKKADEKTPAPTVAEFLGWRNEYAAQKQNKVADKCRVLNTRGNSGRLFENDEKPPLVVDVVVDVDVKTKPLSADADAAPATVQSRTQPTEDELVFETAKRICGRHPAKRRCSVPEAVKRLKVILGKLPKLERAPKLAQINRNHEGWCESEQWKKDDGEYAKGLANWLAPTEGRYDMQAPVGTPFVTRQAPASVLQGMIAKSKEVAK